MSKPLMELNAGAMSMCFEEGRLHTICVAGVEVWRSVMFLYRDPAWGTPLHKVHRVNVDSTEEAFNLRFEGRCVGLSGLSWHARISGLRQVQRESVVTFEIEAQVTDDLFTSRTGFCLLHPLNVAGNALEIGHADGRVSHSSFPTLISPWQPFTQIRSVRHEFAPRHWAHCTLHGDVFEMEDQRNFSDASFKTYGRSNLMPRPYRLSAGDCIKQSVELRIEKLPVIVAMPAKSSLAIHVDVLGKEESKLPALGLLSTQVHSALKPNFWHHRIDLRGSNLSPKNFLLPVSELAGIPCRIDILLDDDKDALEVCGELSKALTIEASKEISNLWISIFPSTPRSIQAIRKVFPGIKVGGGTPFFFTHLNRTEIPPGVDYLSFLTSPIVHVADDLSVMQSLATLPVLVHTLRSRGIDQPLHIGPVSIGMTVDPFNAKVSPVEGEDLPMAYADRRDSLGFGAAWAFAYLVQMTHAGATHVSFAHAQCLQAFEGLLDKADCQILGVCNSDQTRVAVLALPASTGCDVWLANLTREHLVLSLNGIHFNAQEVLLPPLSVNHKRLI